MLGAMEGSTPTPQKRGRAQAVKEWAEALNAWAVAAAAILGVAALLGIRFAAGDDPKPDAPPTPSATSTPARKEVRVDPSAVRVVGNVTGEPPFTGSINHPGWRVKDLKLATPPEGADEFVLQPAEVQIA